MIATQIEPATTLAQLQESKPERVTIVLLSGDLDRVMAAFIIATGAAAMGMRVTMFFTFWGLKHHSKKGRDKFSQGLASMDVRILNKGGANRLPLCRS